MSRGEIWWADFGEPVGSEPGYRRPALVVSSNRFNNSRIATVMVSVLSTNLRLAAAPGNVELANGEGGVPKRSVVNVSQTAVVDRSRLVEQVGALSPITMQKIDDGLRLLLDL